MGDFEPDVDSDKDDMTLLNEILNAPSTSGDDFSREWSAVFGDTPLNPTANYPTPAERERPPHESAQFMPSSLLDLNQQQQQMGAAGPGNGAPPHVPPPGKVAAHAPCVLYLNAYVQFSDLRRYSVTHGCFMTAVTVISKNSC